MEKIVWIVLVLIAGAMLPLQAGINAKFGRALESPLWASFFSFAVGLLGLMIYLMMAREKLNVRAMQEVSWWGWSGGLIGAFYITVSIFAFPRIGGALTFGLIVAGQLVVSLVMDHYAWLVQQPHPINKFRIIGMVLILAGVLIIRKF